MMEANSRNDKGGFLQINNTDNVLVALIDLEANTRIQFERYDFVLQTRVKAKHKFSFVDFQPGEIIIMYGVVVGEAMECIPKGTALTTENIKHAAAGFSVRESHLSWQAPDVERWRHRTFNGYHRADGSVGTANFWLIVPLVFCENRNTDYLSKALLKQLGYKKPDLYETDVSELVQLYKAGKSIEELMNWQFAPAAQSKELQQLFPNVDGVKSLSHTLGCGGTRSDSDALCGLLAGYITHPNVAGATVLSLGCQHAQVSILQTEIAKRDQAFAKPLYIFEQQKEGTEKQMMEKVIKATFAGLIEANQLTRKPAPLSKLCIGLECGGSDGFSGISANPAIGIVSDRIVALGGSTILSEFPELCGVEQELSDRCEDKDSAERFLHLMRTYNARAEASGSGFYANPSPGNIRDGLITDAIKSAGAAKKGGNSPVKDVLDYPEKTTRPGLNLLCTPGSDVESTTAEVGAGANIVLFSTGLGTPTGNPVAPVLKLSSNTALSRKMPDIIDLDCGTVIDGSETLEQVADRIMELVIQVAGGEVIAKADLLGQDDFIPWKRGVSL